MEEKNEIRNHDHNLSMIVVVDEENEAQQNSLIEARNLRKKAQDEVKALENRILLLKKEEERAQARIMQTKKRAEEIVKKRKENLVRKKVIQRELAENEKLGPTPQTIKKRFAEKELAKASRRKYLREMYLKKKSDAQNFRTERRKHEERLCELKQNAKEEARKKSNEVRRQKEDAARRLQKRKEEQRLKARIEYQARVNQEKRAIKASISKVKQLEKLESDLIAKLQNTQVFQREAYSKLEDALTPTPPNNNHKHK